jgi:excisionase family DNA binding protein
MRRFLAASEVADLFHVTWDSVNALARAGQIPAYRLRSLWRFDSEELETWIAEHRAPRAGTEGPGGGAGDRWLEQRLRELGGTG